MSLRDGDGRRMLISGGAQGIGAACVAGARRAGWLVSVLDLEPAVHEADDGIECVELDLADQDACARWISEQADRGVRFDAALLVAGIQIPESGPIDAEIWQLTMRVNALASAQLLLGLGPCWSPGAGVVLFGSVAADDGSLLSVSYAMSKAALRGLMASAIRRFAERGLRVCILHPGATDTPLSRRMRTVTQGEVLATRGVSADMMAPEVIAEVALDMVDATGLSGVEVRVDRARWLIPR